MKLQYIYMLMLLAFASCANEADLTHGNSGESSLCLVTRAGNTTETDDLAMKVLDSKGNLYEQYKTGEIPKKITLEPGKFTLVIYTDNQETWQEANDGKGEPCYYTEYSLEMQFDEIRRDTIAVAMTNYAVTLKLPEYFHDLFNAHTFHLSDEKRNTAITEGEKAYFASSEAGFNYSLEATNTDGVTHSHSRYKFNDVENGKLYTVKYVYELDANTGGVEIEIENDMQMNDTEVEI